MRKLGLSTVLDFLGITFFLGGWWLVWDWANSAVNQGLSDGSGGLDPAWRFCYPFFLSCIDGYHWTHAFDVGFTLSCVGFAFMFLAGHDLKGLMNYVRGRKTVKVKVLRGVKSNANT